MKTKRLCMTMLFLAATMMSMAQDNSAQTLVVWLADGTKVRHLLTDEPKTTFQNGALYLSTIRMSISYPLERVLRYTYEGNYNPVGISQLRSGEVRMWQTDDAVKFEGLEPGTPVEVYGSDGVLQNRQTAQSGIATVASLTGLPAGVYIIKIKDQTIKFLKK